MMRIVRLLIAVLLLGGCSESNGGVINGSQYITNITYLFVVNDRNISQQYSILWNSSVDEACIPNSTMPQPSIVDTSTTLSLHTGDVVVAVRIFDDIERPECFKGYMNDYYQFMIGGTR